MRALILAAAAFASLPPVDLALAQETPVQDAPTLAEAARSVTHAALIRAPSSAAMVWPGYAFYTHMSGHVLLDCVIDEKGKLKPCAVVEDTPPGQGFADAAITFLQPTQMRPPTIDGAPIENAHMRVAMEFDGKSYGVRFSFNEQPTPPGVAKRAPAPASAVSSHAPRLPGRDVVFANFDLFTDFSAGPYYPEAAMRQEVTGSAQLDCAVGDKGALDACVIAAEAPDGMGFGKAAALMARWRAIRLKTGDEAEAPRAGDRVRVSVPFTMGHGR